MPPDTIDAGENNEPVLFPSGRKTCSWEPTDDEIACAVELNTLATFRSQFRRLKSGFNSFRAILEASPEELSGFFDSGSSRLKSFLEARRGLEVGREWRRIPENVGIITYFDCRYPAQLKDLHNPPPVLYVKGDLSFDYSASLAIVGSRGPSDYGRLVAEHFSSQLASWGFTIISGGARGIDSVAHQAALKAGGKTIAVLGCGIDQVFPAENRRLFDRIAETGALITEFPVGTRPEGYNFPARNRIIATLGRATLVVEAQEKSGALITANLSMSNGREVFAVPGRITDGRSKGTNRLISDGAHIALEPTDIPLRLGLIVLENSPDQSCGAGIRLEGDEALVYAAVTLEAKPADIIVREVGLPAARVFAALVFLQASGLVKELPGGRFIRPVGSSAPSPLSEEPQSPQGDPEEGDQVK